MANSITKILFVSASIVGMLQGLMSLIGGIVAICDKSFTLEITTAHYSSEMVNDRLTKYDCGWIAFENDPAPRRPTSDIKDFDPGEMDRGWFMRAYGACRDYDCGFLEELYGLKYVLSYALACGIGWILGSILVYIALCTNSRILAYFGIGAFSAFYIVAIVLFVSVWNSVKKVEDDCIGFHSDKFKNQAKRSAREYLGYNICSFILILGSIIITCLGIVLIKPERISGAPALAQENQTRQDTSRRLETHDDNPNKEQTSNIQYTENDNAIKVIQPTNERNIVMNDGTNNLPTEISYEGKEFIGQFTKLNKYLSDKQKMKNYSDKQFDKTDKDKSGTINLTEFKQFVIETMVRKKLPPPSDKKIETLLKKYDKDENKSLNKDEFALMFTEIFIESRETLLMEYAVKKANSWKTKKNIIKNDTAKITEVDILLKDEEKFSAEVSEVSKNLGNDLDENLNIKKMNELAEALCKKYEIFALNNDDLKQIMIDIGKYADSLDKNDIRFIALAAMAISKYLLT